MATLTKEPWITGEVITASKLNKTTDGGKYILNLSDDDYDTELYSYSFVITLDEQISVENLLGMIIVGKLQNSEILDLATRDSRVHPFFQLSVLGIDGYGGRDDTTCYELVLPATHGSAAMDGIYYFPEWQVIASDPNYTQSE